MNSDEKKGYARGYAAGRKKQKQGRLVEQQQRERQAFLDKAFLVALPFAMEQQTWKRGDKPIISVADRVKLAVEIADAALKARRYA